ncbi:FadR/GntR family transcriptional regulator [Neobacillus drentensis]|uniref:FadR/GntR family transcriptional regulator n=1 Tax=Neobacillus drentensis TaxID=220684 RepID=UPI002FFD9C60
MASSIQPIKRSKVSIDVAAKLQEILQSGEYKVGDKLPPEKVLAERFGVSRSSIREALKSLEAEGSVRIVHGVGTIVSSGRETISSSLASLLVIEGTTVPELFEARLVLESETAFRAAERITTSSANGLIHILEQLNDNRLSDEAFVELDVALHIEIARATKNKIFINIMENLKDVLIEYSLRTIKLPGRREKANEGHRILTEAILARKPSAARKAAKDHVEAVEFEIAELFKGGEGHVTASHDLIK